jgi:hypothetical protein
MHTLGRSVATAAQVRGRGDVRARTFIIEGRDGNGRRQRLSWGRSSATTKIGTGGGHLDWGRLEGWRAIGRVAVSCLDGRRSASAGPWTGGGQRLGWQGKHGRRRLGKEGHGCIFCFNRTGFVLTLWLSVQGVLAVMVDVIRVIRC